MWGVGWGCRTEEVGVGWGCRTEEGCDGGVE